MKNLNKSEIVTGAQIALGENYAAPFWNEVESELTRLEHDTKTAHKPKLAAVPRWTKPARIGHY